MLFFLCPIQREYPMEGDIIDLIVAERQEIWVLTPALPLACCDLGQVIYSFMPQSPKLWSRH